MKKGRIMKLTPEVTTVKDVTTKGVHFSNHDKFKSLSTNTTLTNVGSSIFKTMITPYTKDGIITDEKGYVTLLHNLESNDQRPPMDERTGGDYTEEMKNIKRDVNNLVTDPKTGKKRVFIGEDKVEYVMMYQWRDKKKLQSYSKKDSK